MGRRLQRAQLLYWSRVERQLTHGGGGGDGHGHGDRYAARLCKRAGQPASQSANHDVLIGRPT